MGRIADPATDRFVVAHSDVLLTLAELDLELVRPELMRGYAARKGGRDPRDPVAMLRCLVLMLLVGTTSINDWVRRMDAEPLWAVLAGFPWGEPRPGVGTLYDFCDRLLNGPFERRCAHAGRPTDRYRKARNRFRRGLKKEKASALAAGETGEGRIRRTVDAAQKARNEPLPKDFASRMEGLLMACGVLPSARRGLLGKLEQLDVAADGTLVGSQAHGRRRPACDCPREGRTATCGCDRL